MSRAAQSLSSIILALLASALASTYPHSVLATLLARVLPTVTVVDQDAAPNFPDTVDFTLKPTGF